jgi:hypothetical protein
MSEEVFDVRTGPVRVSGYAIKLRRVINGVLGARIGKGKLDTKSINESISEINTKLYEVIVNKYKVPKEAIVNIGLKFRVVENKVVVDEIGVEVFDKDEILSKNVTEDVKQLFS